MIKRYVSMILLFILTIDNDKCDVLYIFIPILFYLN